MNEQRCPVCDGTNVEPGKILSTGKMHFRPEHARFLKLKTANIEVQALLCLDCGHLALRGDVEKAKAITQKDQPCESSGVLKE